MLRYAKRCGDCVSWKCNNMNLWIGVCNDKKSPKHKQKVIQGHSKGCKRYGCVPSRP